MKHKICLLLLVSFLLTGCMPRLHIAEKKQYTATFLTLFDTVTTIVGKADSETAFHEKAQKVHDELLHYHQIFDIYKDYDGLNNLKTVNDQAGTAPVTVDRAIIDLLLDCKEYYAATNGKVNAAMGSILKLWHEARSDSIDDPVNAYLPDQTALENASAHTNFDAIIIDEAASTVYISDPDTQLDVGAIAKGWSVQRVSKTAPKGLLISVGGNVCATGPKDETGTAWVVGIQNPESSSEYLHTINVTSGSVVTSGDYQRYYVVDGKPYHHIIDPATLQPSAYWCSVTIVCPDSGLADCLSTALFLLPQTEGQQLLDKFHAEAMWVDANGTISYSPGFQAMIRT
jgi:thiamine biosynthesis lipoprotein